MSQKSGIFNIGTMPKKTVGFWVALFFLSHPGWAITLHMDGVAVSLDQTRHTHPSLVIQTAERKWFGALFTGSAPGRTLHVSVNGTDYWLGQWCRPGTYRADGFFQCQDCGLGHYCTGGAHRAPCSGGIIACPDIHATTDARADTMVNRVLMVDEVTKQVPGTDMSQWRILRSDSAQVPGDYLKKIKNDLSLVNTVPVDVGVIGPGTYLFVQKAGSVCPASMGTGYSSFIMVFDHPVSYKMIHAENVFYTFIDVDGPEFTGWDIKLSPEHYCTTRDEANVANMDKSSGFQLFVYELK